MKTIDQILNNITMYRLLVYGLGGIASVTILFSLIGYMAFAPFDLIVSLLILLASAYFTDVVLSTIWRIPTNSESWLITALILFLILEPTSSFPGILTLALASVIAIASKFLLTWNGKHIFNPAALAAAVVSMAAILPTIWWVGSSKLWPLTLLVGLAVVRKIRRFPLVITFVVISIGLQFALLLMNGRPVMAGLENALLSSPLIFFATIMLTEPATMPPRRNQQIVFAAAIAILYTTAWRIGPLYIHPEIALLLGNIYAFIVSPKWRVKMRLVEVQKIADHIHNYVFQPSRPLRFLPGQYMEWTLASVPFDSRGNRRAFTIASSPTEDTVQLGVKFYDRSSAYKNLLKDLQPGASVYASQLAGNFTLPPDSARKLAFIAGGIGITPFRSMLKYLVDTQQQRDIVLIYLVNDMSEVVYADVLQQAQAIGIQIIVLANDNQPLDPDKLQQLVPDYTVRSFFISGPEGLVRSTKKHLKTLGISRRNVSTDYFSGY